MDTRWNSFSDIVRVCLRHVGQFALAVLEKIGWVILLVGLTIVVVFLVVWDNLQGRVYASSRPNH